VLDPDPNQEPVSCSAMVISSGSGSFPTILLYCSFDSGSTAGLPAGEGEGAAGAGAAAQGGGAQGAGADTQVLNSHLIMVHGNGIGSSCFLR
jgi:hypothetical protein